MDEAKYLDLIAQHISGNLPDNLREELFSWVDANEANKAIFEEMTQIWEMTTDQPIDFEPKVDKAWDKVDQKLQLIDTLDDVETTRQSLGIVRQLLRIAAVFVLAFGVGYWFYSQGDITNTQKMVEHITNDQSGKNITLPDGSTVWLNKNTSISFEEDFDPRLIKLEGEAFFDVEKLDGKTFEIISGQAKTVVLGTSFNVRAYPQENLIEVTVETGKVAFSGKAKTIEPVLVPANNSAVFYKKEEKFAKKENKIVNANAWRTNELEAFKNISTKTVLEGFERYFNKEIKVSNDNINNCPFTMPYMKNPKLEEVLQIMKFGLGVEVIQEGNKIILTGEGCE